MINYYYDPAQAGLEMLTFEDAAAHEDYGFNILAFWADRDGLVYSASDSGCSCPSPFEDYHSLQQLERVGSVEQAVSIFKAWNDSYGHKIVDSCEERKLIKWLENYMCPLWTEMLRLRQQAVK